MEKLGPEMLPNPQIDGKISSGFLKVTGLHSFSIARLSDQDPNNLAEGGLETFLGHFPAGSSFRCVNHFRQLSLDTEFKKYDFGTQENHSRYNSDRPPVYDLKKIEGIPIALLCGSGDRLASPQDYKWLRDQLMHTLCYYKEYDFGHLGFLIPANKRIFFDMLELSKIYVEKL